MKRQFNSGPEGVAGHIKLSPEQNQWYPFWEETCLPCIKCRAFGQRPGCDDHKADKFNSLE